MEALSFRSDIEAITRCQHRNSGTFYFRVFVLILVVVPANVKANFENQIDKKVVSVDSASTEYGKAHHKTSNIDNYEPSLSTEPETLIESSRSAPSIHRTGIKKKRIRVPRHVVLRLEALKLDLKALSDQGNPSIQNGLFALAIAGTSITIGILNQNGKLALPIYLYAFGTANIVRAITSIALIPNPELPAEHFLKMPMYNVDDIKRKLRYGRSSLKYLANSNRVARVVDSIIHITAGIAILPIAIIVDDYRFTNALDYFVAAGAGLSATIGIFNLFNKTEAEKRFISYEELHNKLKSKLKNRYLYKRNQLIGLQTSINLIPDTVTLTIRGFY